MNASSPQFPTWKDYASANPAILAEIVRQAELRMQAQLQAALASDARAGLLSSLQAAASAALFVAAAQVEISGNAEIAAYVSASSLMIGAILGAFALRPVEFGFVGNQPENWIDSIITQEDLAACLGGTAVHLNKYLKLNDRTMRKSARLVTASLIFLILGPLASAGFLVFRSFCG